jgi:hypothetical protein
MAPDTEAPFRAADLIGSAGVGANGEKLVNTLAAHYPVELDAALQKTENVELSKQLDDAALKSVATIAGVDEVADAIVRGGARRDDDAVVTYAYYDAAGDTVKGFFPFSDLGKNSSKGHVSQRDLIGATPEAVAHAEAQAKARAAALAEGVVTPAGPVDPIASYEELTAPQVVEYLNAHPDRAEVVKALEVATRGEDQRKTVMQWEAPAPDAADGGQGDGQGDPPSAS